MKHFLKKGDVIIILASVILCAFMLLPRLFGGDGKLIARVYENGKVTHEINLGEVSESYEIEISGAVLLVENGAVSYKNADCPDKTCMHFGKLTKAGDTASCVPNKTVVTLTKAKTDSKIDVITY